MQRSARTTLTLVDVQAEALNQEFLASCEAELRRLSTELIETGMLVDEVGRCAASTSCAARTPRRAQVGSVVDAETKGVNSAFAANAASFADLIQRLAIDEEAVVAAFREQFVGYRAQWRDLLTQQLDAALQRRLGSLEFTDPPARREILRETRALQRRIGEEAQGVARALLTAPPSPDNVEAMDAGAVALQNLRTKSDDAAVECIAKLRRAEDELEARGRAALADTEAAVRLLFDMVPAAYVQCVPQPQQGLTIARRRAVPAARASPHRWRR